jgi:RimJ/RimL family protein N-acetyltransferase
MSEGRFDFSPMNSADIEAYRSWFSDPELARRLSEPSEAWIAYVAAAPRPAAWSVTEQGELAAHIQVEYLENGHCSVAIAIKPALRSRHLSTEIMSRFIETTLAGQEVVEARVEQDNIASIRVLEKLGFSRVSAEPDADAFLGFELRRG